MARKLSRLQTWEKAILTVAASGKIFSAHSIYLELKKIYIDLTLIDVHRAIRALIDLDYLEVNEHDPYFHNRASYICSAAGHDFYAYCNEQESKLWNLIMLMP